MRKVIYQGIKYKVSKSNKIKVCWIKFILLLKRWKRRLFAFISPNGGLYLMIAILWILFGLFVYLLGTLNKELDPYTVWDVIWELKIPCFTSLILSMVIGGYAQAMDYRNKIRDQYELYIDTLGVFDSLFAPFLGEELWYYMPFFNEECTNDTLQYIMKNNLLGQSFNNNEFKMILKNISDQLDTIKNEVETNSIIGMHKRSLEENINYVQRIINSKIQKCEENLYEEELNKLVDLLLRVVADIRRPWRWDIDNDKKILEILDEYKENDIKNDFYYSMHLYGHKMTREEEECK